MTWKLQKKLHFFIIFLKEKVGGARAPPAHWAATALNITLNLENASSNLLTWCFNNGMKANPDKYHFLHTANIDLTVKIDQIWKSKVQKKKIF